MSDVFNEVFDAYNLRLDAEDYGNGHINDTYVVGTPNRYIIQRINKNIFKKPEEVMENIAGVTEFLRKKIEAAGGDPKRETLNIIRTKDGKTFYKSKDGDYYRMYYFVENAVSYEEVTDPMQLYHAARAFGKFQNMLSDYPAEKLHEVIPKFHDTRDRYRQFHDALDQNRSGRAGNAEAEIKFVLDREKDAGVIVDALESGRIPLRVTHNDTKLNNVLLDVRTGEGVCVIDLDTVMPGSLLYDYGDALRFGGSSGAEDEKDLSKIWFDIEKFRAFTEGFIEELPSITEEEIKLLPFSIKLMTLECGSRFLADYINGDIYFKTHYPEHNLDRCRTQFKLVKEIEDKMDELNSIVREIAAKYGH